MYSLFSRNDILYVKLKITDNMYVCCFYNITCHKGESSQLLYFINSLAYLLLYIIIHYYYYYI